MQRLVCRHADYCLQERGLVHEPERETGSSRRCAKRPSRHAPCHQSGRSQEQAAQVHGLRRWRQVVSLWPPWWRCLHRPRPVPRQLHAVAGFVQGRHGDLEQRQRHHQPRRGGCHARGGGRGQVPRFRRDDLRVFRFRIGQSLWYRRLLFEHALVSRKRRHHLERWGDLLHRHEQPRGQRRFARRGDHRRQ